MQKNKTFVKPPVITNYLLEELKAGRITFVSGQWFITKKYGNKKIKYVGTYNVPKDGVVSPTVVFSYPKEREHIVLWNQRFKNQRDELEKLERINRDRYPKTKDVSNVLFYKQPEKRETTITPQIKQKKKWYERISFIFKEGTKR